MAFAGPIDLAPAALLRAKFEQKRQELLNTGLYLGDPAFCDFVDQRVVWRRIGGYEDRLVTKASADALADFQDTLAACEFVGNAEQRECLPELVSAKLSVVVYITPEDYWLTSCGMWKKPTSGCRTFDKMKLSCTGVAPTHEVFQPDFGTAALNLRALLQKVANPAGPVSGVLVRGEGDVEKIKFRHVLFEPISDAEDSGQNHVEGNNVLPEFDIAVWPAHFDAAKEALQNMVSTHRVVPVPAYNIQGNLIHPEQYRKHLERATARVTFSLKHWCIGAKYKGSGVPGDDTYIADIESIRVLEPPRSPVPDTPRKRKIAATDPLDIEMSPSRRSRTG
ncbi:hypothetical protein GALMADRAFT_1225905 [Galerina marginata CBS 339.88]|uniref:Uncharacterized protein n=1 Tax=Galerina marginata (strain CBS 339.88) TaxID=685588 RepID=A0A067T9X7_GALM3|nr:hypothetical protein GALMADRAFT_1225905 [Galerina marginata CBS 339.88]